MNALVYPNRQCERRDAECLATAKAPGVMKRALGVIFVASILLGVRLPGRAQPAHPGASPPPATAQADDARIKALAGWSYSLALSAASWGAPLVTMYALRANDVFGSTPKAPPNGIWRMSDISTPELSREAGYVTPNVNVIYGFGFLDLAAQPVVLTLPDSHGRYYMVEICDMWTNAFAYPAGAVNGYRGGTYALVGPGWRGTLPAGVKRIDAPTRWVLIQPRIHVKNRADLNAARAVLDAIRTQGLAQYLGRPAPPTPAYAYPAPVFADANQPVSALDFQNPFQFWQILSLALDENPPPKDQVSALLPMFAPLGLKLGTQWDPSRVNPLILRSMQQAAAAIGPLLNSFPPSRVVNGWAVPPPSIGNFREDYLTRAIVGRVGLTANTPREAIYIQAARDDRGDPLSGERAYAITFRQTPPFVAPGFWSLTMYDASDNYTVPNALGRYALGSDDELRANPDGTTTIFVGRDKPAAAPDSNWLPAPPGAFYLILRSYAPGRALIESLTDPAAYTPPDVRPIN